jgi:hypothetical protein
VSPYWTKPGFAEKQLFKLRKIVFSHMLRLLPIHSKPNYMWIDLDLATTLTSCLRGVECGKQTTGNQENYILADPLRCPKQTPRDSNEPPTFKREDRHADHCATGPLPLDNCAFLFSLCAGCKGLGFGLGCGCKKDNFSRPNKVFFSALPL